MRLETRMDNHEIVSTETKGMIKELQKEQQWQTKQIFMGLGALAVIVFVLELIFKR